MSLRMKLFPMVKYRSGYKHIIENDVTFTFQISKLREDFCDSKDGNFIDINEFYFEPIITRWVEVVVDKEGDRWLVTLKKGMGSDGTSAGLDRISILRRGAFVHDSGYHLMKIEKCKQVLRPVWDKIAFMIWIDSSVPEWLAKACLFGLKIGGGPAALPKNRRPILIAE